MEFCTLLLLGFGRRWYEECPDGMKHGVNGHSFSPNKFLHPPYNHHHYHHVQQNHPKEEEYKEKSFLSFWSNHGTRNVFRTSRRHCTHTKHTSNLVYIKWIRQDLQITLSFLYRAFTFI